MLLNKFRFRKINRITENQIGEVNTHTSSPKYEHDPVAIQNEIEEKDGELLRVKGFFPIDLFPNELIIRKKTVSVIKRNFLTSQTETFLVKDIGLLSLNNAVIFSELRVSYKAPYEDIIINKLLKNEAKQAKALLDKLMMVRSEPESDDEVATLASSQDMYYKASS